MPKVFDRELVDSSVSEEEIELANYPDPAGFPLVDNQDEPDEARSLLTVPATPAQACAHAKALRDNHTNVGIGMCLRTVRGPIFGLPSLWPTASIAYTHGKPFHRFDDLTLVPRGMAIFWATPGSDDPGHVALSLGGGLCSTTDFHENGFEGVALISKLADWCGDPFRGGAEILNGFDVWPNPDKPDPKPVHEFHAWDAARKVQFLKSEADRQRADGHPKRAEQLETWADKIAARAKAKR